MAFRPKSRVRAWAPAPLASVIVVLLYDERTAGARTAHPDAAVAHP